MNDSTLPAIDEHFVREARARLDRLTKPAGSLGRLEDLAAWMCGWQQTVTPTTERAHTLIFAGNHGVVAQGVSAFPAAVTAQMVANFEAGGAAISQLCRAIPSALKVTALSLDTPTQDFTTGPAMNREECEAAFAAGQQAVPEDADIIVLGEMGIGNTTPAAAIAAFLGGGEASGWVGRGTGIDDAAKKHKAAVVEKALALHRPHIRSSMELLARLGGRELAAVAGAIGQARAQRIPVLLDGYVATAAAAALTLDHKDALAHTQSGHASAEPGHQKLLALLGLEPILNLGMRLGEASGAQLALGIVRAALACYNGMATFDSAGVSNR
ncbi:MAG: nicotinate-nucleotide--dimethylbenzimidazole phosphoribosyltransferase [Alphaproteobacteria bacterium]|nr:nicotinate-nucleotide--dimethylbenzimidazole phosphoribosyltransferase [Alphaproteobacteria bacterium]